jgi:hypothetical protein
MEARQTVWVAPPLYFGGGARQDRFVGVNKMMKLIHNRACRARVSRKYFRVRKKSLDTRANGGMLWAVRLS